MRAGRLRGWLGLTGRPRTARLTARMAVTALAAVLAAGACTGSPSPPTATSSVPSPVEDGTPGPTPDATPSPPAPPFRFAVKRTQPVLVGTLPPRTVRRTMQRAVEGIRTTMTRLHRLAFLSEDALAGRFGPVIELFAKEAQPSARDRLGALTLGREPERYTEVRGAGGWLRVTVLIGRFGGPVTATARSFLSVRAVRTDDSVEVIQSRGSWFLRPTSRGWVITGFSVRRSIRVATP